MRVGKRDSARRQGRDGGCTTRRSEWSAAPRPAAVALERAEELRRVAERFSVAITDEMAALIDPADPVDPIAAQFVPNAAELSDSPDDRPDPVGDELHSPVPGIVHRYPDRVLLKPIWCARYIAASASAASRSGRAKACWLPTRSTAPSPISRQHPEIWEVIVTGGDPFLLSPRRIAEIVRRLDGVAACRGDPLPYAGAGRRSADGSGPNWWRRSRPRKRCTWWSMRTIRAS